MATSSSEPVTQTAREAGERFLLKLQSAWQDLAACSTGIAQASTAAQQLPLPRGHIPATLDWYRETADSLLAAPLGEFLKLQPIRGALEAMRACDQEIPIEAGRSRAGIDRQFQRLATLAALDLCEPWRIWRGGNHPDEWRDWHKRNDAFNKDASAILERYARWTQSVPVNQPKDSRRFRNAKSEGWWRRHRALLATVEADGGHHP